MGANISKWTANLVDEIRDLSLGENNKKDKTQPFHFTPKFVPGLDAIFNVLEVRDSDKIKER